MSLFFFVVVVVVFMSVILRADPSATILQREGGERKEWLGDNQKLFRNLTQKLHKSLTHVEWPLDRRKP